MKLMLIRNCLIAAATLGLVNVSFAEYTDGAYFVPQSSVKVKVKEKNKFTFDGWKHVRKVKVKVNGRTVSKTKMKLEVNGADRFPESYFDGYAIYDIGEVTKSITLVNVDSADLDIDSIICDTLDHGFTSRVVTDIGRDYSGYTGYDYGRAYGLNPRLVAVQIADASHLLAEYVGLADEQTYLRPIYVQAGRCIASSGARGPYSMTAGECLQTLIATIDYSQEFIQARLGVRATFRLTVDLLTFRDQLERMLDFWAPIPHPHTPKAFAPSPREAEAFPLRRTP